MAVTFGEEVTFRGKVGRQWWESGLLHYIFSVWFEFFDNDYAFFLELKKPKSEFWGYRTLLTQA